MLVFLPILAVSAPVIAERPAERISTSILQVGIVTKADRVILRPEGPFSAVDQRTGETHSLQGSHTYKVARTADGLSLGSFEFQGPVRLLPRGPNDLIRVGEKRYSGSFIVRPNSDDTVSVISELGIEEYLYGVLPAETNPNWPLEALKAQAVVARTFTLNNLGKFRSSGFDLSNDSRSQAYADVNQQSANVIRAVKETEGQVLSWEGKLLPVYFHSCCGGHTASAEAIWGGTGRDTPAQYRGQGSATSSRGKGKPPRPLRGVSDSYCRASVQYQWTAYVSSEDIASALQTHGFPIAPIKNIRSGRRDWSGFLETLKVGTDREWIDVRAKDFRDWIGNTEIKSTKILKILRHRNGFEFIGRGFGHGVGLCQWGAYFMAQRGKNYRKILAYYFPGAKLAKYEE